MNTTRDKATGRYEQSTWDRVCKCGHTLGVHAAEVVDGMRPCFHGDEPGAEICHCEKFRKAR